VERCVSKRKKQKTQNMATLTSNSYGKINVRVMKVTRNANGVHDVCEVTVRAILTGDFAASYDGDNTKV
jgi:urate oxidase